MRESHSRSIAKAVSWRGTGNLDALVLSLITDSVRSLEGSNSGDSLVLQIFTARKKSPALDRGQGIEKNAA